MKRTLLKIVVWFSLIAGVLAVILALLLCLLGLPAFMSTISGTTSLNMAGEDSEVLEASFIMAAGGILLLMQGILNCLQGALGLHGLKSGDSGKFVFMCGVIAFSTIFEMAIGLYLSSALVGLATIAFQAAMAALAWTQGRRAA